MHGVIRGAAGYGLLTGGSSDLCKLAIASYVLEILFASQMCLQNFAKPLKLAPLCVRVPCAVRHPCPVGGSRACSSVQVRPSGRHGGVAVAKSVMARRVSALSFPFCPAQPALPGLWARSLPSPYPFRECLSASACEHPGRIAHRVGSSVVSSPCLRIAAPIGLVLQIYCQCIHPCARSTCDVAPGVQPRTYARHTMCRCRAWRRPLGSLVPPLRGECH